MPGRAEPREWQQKPDRDPSKARTKLAIKKETITCMANLLATKPLDMLMSEAGETGEHSLKRALGPINLITLGIGAIIGAGIFVLTGAAAAQYAGPAIVLSYVLAG